MEYYKRYNEARKGSRGKEQQMRLRVHHLLCIPLYVGHGYGDAFCQNMERVIEKLKEGRDELLTVVCEADMICEGCPNLTEYGVCRMGGTSVEEKDRRLAENLGIQPKRQYTCAQLFEIARKKLNGQIFETSCRNCEWFGKGLCTYEKWRESV